MGNFQRKTETDLSKYDLPPLFKCLPSSVGGVPDGGTVQVPVDAAVFACVPSSPGGIPLAHLTDGRFLKDFAYFWPKTENQGIEKWEFSTEDGNRPFKVPSTPPI